MTYENPKFTYSQILEKLQEDLIISWRQEAAKREQEGEEEMRNLIDTMCDQLENYFSS